MEEDLNLYSSKEDDSMPSILSVPSILHTTLLVAQRLMAAPLDSSATPWSMTSEDLNSSSELGLLPFLISACHERIQSVH